MHVTPECISMPLMPTSCVLGEADSVISKVTFSLWKNTTRPPERGSPSSQETPRAEALGILTGCQFFNAKLKEKFAATTWCNLKKINHSYLQPADSSLSRCNHQAPRERLLLSY